MQWGASVALSFDGSVLAVGAPGDNLLTTNPEPTAPSVGGVYVYSGEGYSKVDIWKAESATTLDECGFGLGMSDDGSTVL